MVMYAFNPSIHTHTHSHTLLLPLPLPPPPHTPHSLPKKKRKMVPFCLILGFMAMKRSCDQGYSYKGKHLLGAGLQFLRFSPLSWWKAWQCRGRHGAGERPGNFTS